MSGRRSAISLASFDEPPGDAAGAVKLQLDDRHARGTQASHVGLRREQAHDGDFVGNGGLGGGKTRQHRLGTATSKTRRNVDDLARPRSHAHLSRHACSISTVHSGYCQLRLPSMCSCQARRTGSTRTNP